MAEAILKWTANSEPDLAKYNVYRRIDGTSAQPLTLIASVPKGTHIFKDVLTQIDGDVTYSITAVDTSGNESGQSVSVSKTVNTIPPSAPTGLSVVIQ